MTQVETEVIDYIVVVFLDVKKTFDPVDHGINTSIMIACFIIISYTFEYFIINMCIYHCVRII